MLARQAIVGNLRSSDKRVHLKLGDEDGRADFDMDPRAYAIAAAAYATSEKTVWMTYETFTPGTTDKFGVFTGVQLATDNWTR